MIPTVFQRFAPVVLALSCGACSVFQVADPNPPKSVSSVLPKAAGGDLVQVAQQGVTRSGAGAGESAFLLLPENRDALRWRLALVDHATTSIDAQYFIWQDDLTANLLIGRILAAADRGVRVRLLVDDLALASSDGELSALDSHPQIELRLFNPTLRRQGFAGALTDWALHFRELNRRMHNKSLVVDGQVAIVGGRNIGDEYFGLSEKYNFRDLDVIAAGPVVPEIAHAFDDYWNSEPAYPTGALAKVEPDDLAELRREVVEAVEDGRDDGLLAGFAIPEGGDWSALLGEFARRADPGIGHFIQDDPVTHRGEQVRMVDSLDLLTDDLESEFIICTPYLIPTGDWENALNEDVSKGRVKILTSGLAGVNHTIVNSKYRKYRRPILATGAELYEARPDPPHPEMSNTPPAEPKFVSLHTKTMLADRRRAYIGSLNLDPRAVILNTENGLLIDSPELGEKLGELLDSYLADDSAWRVTVDENGDLVWSGYDGDRTIQPARGFGQRVVEWLGRLLPVESQL